VLIGYQFIDDRDKFTVSHDGTQIIKNVEKFLTGRTYNLIINITNTSEIQMLGNLIIHIPGNSMFVNPPESA